MIGSGRRDRLRRAMRIGWRHRLDLVRALVLLPVVALRLRRRGYRATRDWVDSLGLPGPGEPDPSVSGDPPAPRPPAAGTVGDLAFVVRQAARLIPDATCLRRSLVLRHLLNRAGIPSAVVLGARPAQGGRAISAAPGSGAGERPLQFHAWVEVDGEVVSEPPSAVSGYVVLDEGIGFNGQVATG